MSNNNQINNNNNQTRKKPKTSDTQQSNLIDPQNVWRVSSFIYPEIGRGPPTTNLKPNNSVGLRAISSTLRGNVNLKYLNYTGKLARKGKTPLMYHAFKGDIAKVNEILSYVGRDPKVIDAVATDKKGSKRTALDYAIMRLYRYLQDPNNYPIYIYNNTIEIISILLNNNASTTIYSLDILADIINNEEKYKLTKQTKGTLFDIIQRLINGIDRSIFKNSILGVKYENIFNQLLIVLAKRNFESRDALSLIQILLKYKPHLDIYHALIGASYYNNINIMKFLIDYHKRRVADGSMTQEEKEKSINESFISAVKNNHIDAMDLLLSEGADINYHNSLALELAMRDENKNLIKYLIERGSNIETPRLFSTFAIHRNLDMVKFLVEHGANIESQKNMQFFFSENIKNYLDSIRKERESKKGGKRRTRKHKSKKRKTRKA